MKALEVIAVLIVYNSERRKVWILVTLLSFKYSPSRSDVFLKINYCPALSN